MAEILQPAFDQTITCFGLSSLQRDLLKIILLRNLTRINPGNLDLIRFNKPQSTAYADGMIQLMNQIDRFKVDEFERNEIPQTHTIIFYYIAIAYLPKEKRS